MYVHVNDDTSISQCLNLKIKEKTVASFQIFYDVKYNILDAVSSYYYDGIAKNYYT